MAKPNERSGRPRGGFKASRHAAPARPSAAGPKAAQKHAAEVRESKGVAHVAREKSAFLRGPRIEPAPITGQEKAADLIDNAFLAYNGGRLREACRLSPKRCWSAMSL